MKRNENAKMPEMSYEQLEKVLQALIHKSHQPLEEKLSKSSDGVVALDKKLSVIEALLNVKEKEQSNRCSGHDKDMHEIFGRIRLLELELEAAKNTAENAKTEAERCRKNITWVSRIIVGAVLVALLGLIIGDKSWSSSAPVIMREPQEHPTGPVKPNTPSP